MMLNSARYFVITLFVFLLTCDFAFGAYCAAGANTCDEYISDVHVGTIHNTSTSCGFSGGYSDYTSLSTDMEIGRSYQITVTNGANWSGDQCGIWIDWNQDEDFYDSGEYIATSGGTKNFQAAITVPAGAVPGQTRMRIRIMYTGTLSPCGTAIFGEVEDYTINVVESGTYELFHETATMGPFGQISGYTFDSSEFWGTRFHLDESTEIATIGGHFVDFGSGTVFGAILSLSGPTALPTGYPLNPSEVVASTVFELPQASMDFRVPLSVLLEPGDYAVIFGAGLLDASSTGAALLPTSGQSWISGTSYITWQGYWSNTYPAYAPRFVVEKATAPKTRIHGVKWNDLNDNGLKDLNEPPLSGWTIFLDDNYNGILDPNEDFTMTDPNGVYDFNDIVPGEYYYVSEVDQDGWINTYPGAGGIHYRLKVEEPGGAVEANFGGYQLHNCAISGYKFNDTNNNGAWDAGEGPLSGWQMYIDTNENGQWDTGEPKTTTDASGHYAFTNVPPGYYSIMEMPQAGWFQTYPGPTSGRLWGLQASDSQDDATLISELNLDTMVIDKEIMAPYPSTVLNGGCLAAGPVSLFYCPLKITGYSTADSLFYEIDSETGTVLNEAVLEMPEDEVAWECTWHNGVLYVMSVVTPLPQGELPEAYLNRYDAATAELISRDPMTDIGADGFASDPYKDLLLCNLFIEFSLYEVDPATAAVAGTIGQQVVPAPEMTYTNGVLYKMFWGSSRNELYMLHREHGGLIGSQTIVDYPGFDTFTGGIGTKGGHRFWIGKENMVANFGGRLDSDAGLSGVKYEDVNGNGTQDTGEPGLAGWTIYVDLDGDLYPDAGEPSDVTDGSGLWSIDGLTSGRYFVREVGRKDYIATEPGLHWISRITVENPRDIVLDSVHNLLYISTAAGTVERYDLGTNAFLAPVTVGDTPQGMDITADNAYLYVTNTTLSGGSGVVHKIDTSTLAVTNLTYSVGTSEDGGYDIAIGSEGRALLTGSYSGSSSLPLRVLDTYTDAITTLDDILGQSTIPDDARVIRSADRSTLWLVENGSSGRVIVYDALSDTFTGDHEFLNSLEQSPIALNRNGSMAAVQLDEHCRIVDGGFNTIMGLEDAWMGLEFRKTGHQLYQFHGGWNRLLTMDTARWDILKSQETGMNGELFETFVNGQTAITDDGRILAMTHPNYIAMHRGEYYTLALPGRVVGGLDFGNQPVLCGDIEDDGDVDLADLRLLAREWLVQDIDSDGDIAGPDGPDGVVDLHDYSCLAGNWGVADNVFTYDEDFETGDFTNLPWQHSGDGPWTIDSSVAFEGSYCAKSAELPWYDESILQLTTTCGEGNLLFMLKNGGGGTFRVFIDGDYAYDHDAGNWEYQDWFLVAVPVEAGTHTFEWYYRPDGFGNEVAWIDAIRFPPVEE